ncbi:uncharacterized protein LOC118181300 isoform X1 [Stegodyphus dumicola]|uniref:uncharacterized protein LOC118181300 isoform X1 n=1 Tax=Stegodyphus dumicola TaxID=202533 RepID=UPI0015AF52BE|nr:uncharacterized protein LOC118181300 isoform X1 [Stegodyphus dumicola]
MTKMIVVHPERVFLWKQLENLYYRDRKFTVEVHEARRVVHTLSSFNLYEDAIEEPVEEFDDLSNAICDPTTQVSVSRRALAPASVTVYVWYAASPNIAKCIWSMAIAQHQFFLDRNHKKSRTCVVRSLSQIASELCRSVQSLSSASSQSNISRSNSSTSLPTIIIEGELSEESKAATIEMLTALQSRRDALQDALKKKTEELKALCLKEGEITGELPPETPFQPGEAQPQVRRRVGTSFTLSDKFICRAKSKDRQTLNDLELHYEIQSKIASAAFKLANDMTARKSVRKLRKVSYQQAANKLKEIEQKLCTLKREKDTLKKTQNVASSGTVDDSGINRLGLPISSSDNSISDQSNFNSTLNAASVPPSTSLPQLSETTCLSAPPSPAKCRQRHQSLQHVPVITTDVYEDVLPYNVHTRRNSSSYSAASEYDTVSCGSSSIASLGIPYRNRFEANLDIEGTNHYSVPNRRASQAFNDPDDLPLDNKSQALNPCCMDNNLNSCCMDNKPSNRYVNVIPMSSSYDERLYSKTGEFSLPESRSAAGDYICDTNSIDNNGILGCSESICQRSVPCDLSRTDMFSHSYSENSLHRSQANSLHHKLEHVHISEPDLNFDSVEMKNDLPHVYSVPMLKNVLPCNGAFHENSYNYENTEYSFNTNSPNVKQIATPVLLQESKRAVSSSSLEYFSPKIKTKEWVETSLDSPVLTKKHKPKHSEASDNHLCHQQAQWAENGLPSIDPYYSAGPYATFQTQENYFDDFHDFPTSSASTLQNSPPLLHSQSSLMNTQEENNSNTKGFFPLQMQSERQQINANQCIYSDEKQYHHYENTVSLARNSNLPVNPNNSYMHDSYGSNSFNIEVPNSRQLSEHSISDEFENKPTVSRTVAEPQQPPKHPNRRINVADNFIDEKLNVQDFHNAQITDHHHEPVNYRETPCTVYSESHCDMPELAIQYSHNSSSYSEATHASRCEMFPDDTHDVQSGQTWQVSVASPKSVESAPLSPPVPQNMSFSPSVEVNVVSVGHFQPYWEETKPYELADFYKYSTKHRKQQRIIPPAHTNESQTQQDTKDFSNQHHFYGQITRETSCASQRDCTYQNEAHDLSSVAQPLKSHDVTSHVPVFDRTGQLGSPAMYYEENSLSPTMKHIDEKDKSLSFGEMDIRISLADTFHEEMVTWYQNQDSVKKATLV